MIDSASDTLDPFVVSVILGMAAVTVVAKLGGLWVLSRFEVSDRIEAGVSVLPGAIVVALLGPELANGGPPEWAATAVTIAVMGRTGNIVLALVAGVAAIVVFRSVSPF